MTKLLKLADVADLLAVSMRTVRRLVARGELAVVRVGRQVRVRPSDLDAYIEASRVATTVECRRRALKSTARSALPALRPGYWKSPSVATGGTAPQLARARDQVLALVAAAAREDDQGED